MAKMKVQAQCGSCGGTGLYEGFAERKGEPVVCMNCGGTGAVTVTYEPYTGRKHKNGVKSVSISRGSFLATGVGAREGTAMTYDEFKRKVPEATIER